MTLDDLDQWLANEDEAPELRDVLTRLQSVRVTLRLEGALGTHDATIGALTRLQDICERRHNNAQRGGWKQRQTAGMWGLLLQGLCAAEDAVTILV